MFVGVVGAVNICAKFDSVAQRNVNVEVDFQGCGHVFLLTTPRQNPPALRTAPFLVKGAFRSSPLTKGRQRDFAREILKEISLQAYSPPTAAKPARAHSISCSSVPPLAPTPPKSSPLIISGSPPPARSSGRPARLAILSTNCGRCFASSATSADVRRSVAAVNALLGATLAVSQRAVSIRANATKCPVGSTTAKLI